MPNRTLGKNQGTKILYIVIAIAGTALASFLALNMTGYTLRDEESPSDSWIMSTFRPNGQQSIDVRDHRFTLNINGTKISGGICNGFGGEIQYIDSATIRGAQIFFTAMLCTDPPGPLKMEVEAAFQGGLRNGMMLSEENNTLTLKDMLTNATFVYGKPM